jgi:hypothetical protein
MDKTCPNIDKVEKMRRKIVVASFPYGATANVFEFQLYEFIGI